MFRYSAIIIFFIISACSPKEPVKLSPQIKRVPAKFSMYSGKPDYSARWWEGFKSRELNNLIDTAISNNLTIAEFQARLKQKKAESVKSGAEKLPTLIYESDNELETEKERGSKRDSSESWELGLTLSYEVDLWDRIKSEQARSKLSFKASREDYNCAVLILSGEVASCWVDLIATYKQISYLEEQLSINMQFMRLLEIRFRNAGSSNLDLYQQRKVIEKIKSSMIEIKGKKRLLENQLSVLTGKPPGNPFILKASNYPSIRKVPSVGVPADILSMRPDIRAAGLRLKSAGWAVAAAKADRLPKLSFSASYTYTSEKLRDIFNNWLWNLTANIAGPIFDGGRRKAEVERTKFVVEERIASYKKTVINAIKEVEDALAKENQSFEYLSSIDKRISIADKIVKETEYSYLTGVNDLFPVIREKLALLDLMQDRIDVQAELIKARIVLYKSLGGTWMNEYLRG